MSKYPAIWLTDTPVDSAALLREFENALQGRLKVVYPKNSDWTGITVFSAGKIDHLAELPELRALLAQFDMKNVVGVTYFNLSPNSVLHRHRDMNGNLLFGIIRLHIPIQTNPKAIMEVQKKAYQMPVNTMWALDTSGLHALENKGHQNRIHLVIDVKKASATAKYFPAGSVQVTVHLIFFVIIMLAKILRDIVTKPASIVARIRSIYSSPAAK